MSDFKNLVINMIIGILNNFDSNINKCADLLSEDLFTGPKYTTAMTVSGLIMPFALTIIAICFFIEFIQVTIKMDILKVEYLLKVMIKFVFARVCIDGAYKLLPAIYETAAYLIQNVSGVSTLGATASTQLNTLISGYGFWKTLGLAVTMIIVMLAINIIAILIRVIAYARMFEILVYIAVAPLPCAFLPLGDSGSAGRIPKKFFLSFTAVCLQGLFILISLNLYAAICTDVFSGGLGTQPSDIAYNVLLGALVLCVAVFKSGGWAKQIMDAV